MFQAIERDSKIQIRMSATLENIERTDDRLVNFLKERRVEVEHFALRILWREGLLNAVTHGCGKNPDKFVHLQLERDKEGVLLQIRDPGDGFQWQGAIGQFDSLSGDGGRGLALMSMYSDDMHFNAAGNEVTMRKYSREPAQSGSRS